MEGVKHVWRNAASLLFVTGPFRYCPNKAIAMRALLEAHVRGRTPPTMSFLELDPQQTTTSEDMEIMFVQRHSKSGFMPNLYVFPGGVIDTADYSPEWLQLFAPLKASLASLNSTHDLPLYSQVPPPITGELAFRICAIREMFEEAGVLLVRNKTDHTPLSAALPGTFSPTVRVLPEAVRELWRKRVHNNAGEFLTLCNELNCVPDVWSLVEWTNWLTPRNFKRRYDTVFYMVFCGTKPSLYPDGIETVETAWSSPSAAVRKLSTGEMLLAPPQFAQLMKLKLFPSSPCLHSMALHNSMAKGKVPQVLATRLLTKDRILVSVTEEDDLYPARGSEDWQTALQEPQATHLHAEGVKLVLSDRPHYEYETPDHTAEDLLRLSSGYSRVELYGPNDFRIHDNSNTVREVTEYIDRYSSLYDSKL